jgi:hypothetical protein
MRPRPCVVAVSAVLQHGRHTHATLPVKLCPSPSDLRRVLERATIPPATLEKRDGPRAMARYLPILGPPVVVGLCDVELPARVGEYVLPSRQLFTQKLRSRSSLLGRQQSKLPPAKCPTQGRIAARNWVRNALLPGGSSGMSFRLGTPAAFRTTQRRVARTTLPYLLDGVVHL